MRLSVNVFRIRNLFGVLLFVCYTCNAYNQVFRSTTIASTSPRKKYVKDPLNTADFSQLVQLPVFVDKTMLIKDFLEGPPKVLVTAPHEFGKSVSLDMIRRFLSYPNDPNELQDGNITYDCRIFMNHNLNIYKDKEFFCKHCGQHPVIYINFQNLIVYSEQEILNSFKFTVHTTFRYHDYLIRSLGFNEALYDDEPEEIWEWSSDKLAKMDVKKFVNFWNLKTIKSQSQLDLVKSLRFLSQVLNKYHEKKVVVLIDEFDAIWLKIINQPDSENKFVSDLYHNLIHRLLVKNFSIHRVLIMSCMKYVPFLYLNETRNVQLYNFEGNHRYAKHFGFTSDEVDSLMNKFMIPHDLETVETWYNGFKVPEQNLSLYNPWSIVHYVQDGILQPYSYNFAYTHNIRKATLGDHIRRKLMRLAHGAHVPVIRFPTPANIDCLNPCKIIFCRPKYIFKIKNHDNDFVNYLYECGLVRLTRVLKSHMNRTMIKVASPNFETTQSIFKYMYSRLYYEKHFKFKANRMFEFLDLINVLDKTIGSTQKMFVHLTNSIARMFTYTRLPEDKYALGYAIYYMLKLIKTHPVVHIEVSPWMQNRQRCIFVTTIRKDGTTIIMETRFGSNDTADMALKCIIENRYYENLEERYDFGIQMTGSRIYMGVLLDEEKYVEICYLVNSTNIYEKRCVSNGVNLGIPVYIAAKLRSLLDRYVALKGNSSIFQIPAPLLKIHNYRTTKRFQLASPKRRFRLLRLH